MTVPTPIGAERRAFSALLALLVAPVLTLSLWRPLVFGVGSAGEAVQITAAVMGIGALVVGVLGAAPGLRWRATPLAVVAAAAGSAGLGLGAAGLLSLLAGGLAVTAMMVLVPSRLPIELDGLARRRPVMAVLYLFLALGALRSTAGVSTFMADGSRTDLQVLPGMDFLETHSCLTAYVRGAELAQDGVENLYADPWWAGSHGKAPLPAGVMSRYAPFKLDYYAYPPPFLLAVAPLVPLKADFPAQRALWFGLNSLLSFAGLWAVARWVGGRSAHRVLLLAPLLFASPSLLGTLQVGNFQLMTVVMAVLGMVAFDRDRPRLGAALLAFAILSKISPGILGVLLLAQRRWREALWTAAFGLFYLVVSLLLFGTDPLVSFLTYTLPRLRSGETFAFFAEDLFSIFTNSGPFGLPFKLQLLGVDVGDPWVLGRRVAAVFTVLVVALAFAAGRRTGERRSQAVVWMGLLVVAALQSPFAPGYVAIGLVWAITLLSAEVRGPVGVLTLVGLGVVGSFPVTVDLQPIHVVENVAQALVGIILPGVLVLRATFMKPGSEGAVA